MRTVLGNQLHPNDLLASAHEDGAIRIWDVEAGVATTMLKGHDSAVRCVGFSPDGGLLASGGNDKSIRTWKLPSGTPLHVMHGHNEAVLSLKFSRNGRTLFTGSGPELYSGTGSIKVWDPHGGAETSSVSMTMDALSAIDVSADTSLIATGSKAGRILVWSARTKTVVTTLDCGTPILGVAFSPDGNFVVAGGYSGCVRLWSMAWQEYDVCRRPHQDRVNSVCFSEKERQVLTASSDRTIRVWDASTGRLARSLATDTESCESLALDSKRGVLYGAGSEVSEWNVFNGKELGRLDGAAPLSTCLSISHNDGNSVIASGGLGGAVHVWNANSGKQIRTIVLEGKLATKVTSVSVSNDGEHVAIASRFTGGAQGSGSVEIWNVRNGQMERRLEEGAGNVSCVSYSTDCARIVTGHGGGVIGIWSAKTGTLVRELLGHTGRVSCLAFAPDGKAFASGGKDGVVRIWELATGDERLRCAGHTGEITSVSFSHDGRLMASGSVDGTALVWDLRNVERTVPK